MAQQASIYRSAAGQVEIMALYEKILAAWPIPSQHLRLPTAHGETFVITSETDGASRAEAGAPLVILHGSGSNSATWAGDVVRYSRDRRVYAVDIPGEPGKSATGRFSCHGPAFREWLDEVLVLLGLENASLGGMSLGAWAALDYAVNRPERVHSLVLICPSGICPPHASFGLAALLYLPLGDWGIRRMKALIFKNAVVSKDAEDFFMLTGKHFRFRMEAPTIFADAELRKATMPVLFLAGEDDAVLQSRKTAQRLETCLPNLTACVFGADGHALIGVSVEVARFLAQQDKS